MNARLVAARAGIGSVKQKIGCVNEHVFQVTEMDTAPWNFIIGQMTAEDRVATTKGLIFSGYKTTNIGQGEAMTATGDCKERDVGNDQP
jgi:hypothetical protein